MLGENLEKENFDFRYFDFQRKRLAPGLFYSKSNEHMFSDTHLTTGACNYHRFFFNVCPAKYERHLFCGLAHKLIKQQPGENPMSLKSPLPLRTQ